MRQWLIRRLRRVKFRLASRGRAGRMIVPLVEVVEFSLSHGFREVVYRSRARLRQAPVLSHQDTTYRPLTGDAAPQFQNGDAMDVLVVDRLLPREHEDAGSVRMLALLRMMVDLGHRVTFLPDEVSGPESHAAALRQTGVDVVDAGSPAAFVDGHGHRFNTVILCRVGVAAKYISQFATMRPRPFIIFDTVDLHHLRERRLADLENDQGLARSAERIRETELAVMRSSHLVWVTSSYEAELLNSDRSLPPVEVVPVIQTVRPEVPGFASRRDILFIGAFHHMPNEDAILYFVHEILPLVKAEIPEVRLIIVGSHTPPVIQRLASNDVQVLGFVPDVQPLFDNCRVSIAPLRFGAGVKGKVAQSMAWGLPSVATPVAAEGMHLIDEEHVLIASDARQFAARVIRLYRDETTWRRISEAGRQHVRNYLGYETVRASVRSMLDRALARKHDS